MKRIIHLAAGTVLLVLCACNESVQDPVMKVYHGGREYTILEKADATEEGGRAYLIRYQSQDPLDATIREAEFEDLYSVIAEHIDSNEYQRVVLVAVDHRGRRLGLFKTREYRDSKSVQDVLVYNVEKETLPTEP